MFLLRNHFSFLLILRVDFPYEMVGGWVVVGFLLQERNSRKWNKILWVPRVVNNNDYFIYQRGSGRWLGGVLWKKGNFCGLKNSEWRWYKAKMATTELKSKTKISMQNKTVFFSNSKHKRVRIHKHALVKQKKNRW